VLKLYLLKEPRYAVYVVNINTEKYLINKKMYYIIFYKGAIIPSTVKGKSR